MNRLAVLCCLTVAFLGAAAVQAQDFAAMELETRKINDTLYVLMGGGGNIGVSVGKDGIFIIDDSFAPLAPKVTAAIGKIQEGPVRFVINTHWHGDHTGGNEAFGEAGALLIAHDNVRTRMSVPQFMKLMNREVPASPPEALPIVTFSHRVTLHLNGEEVEATHVAPAHTDGDAIIRFKQSNVVHTGDTYVNGGYPFIDKSSGGSLAGIIASAEALLASIDEKTVIIPGHGELSNKAELGKFRNVLVTARERVTQLIREGQSVEQIVAAKPLAEFDPVYGRGFINPETFLRILYEDLQ